MKELFPGYYKKTEEDIKRIWENGIIFFDTNVLLNLYRYSDSTQSTILDLVKKFSKQIFLPHQAALEYNKNRYEVIAEQEKAYNEFLEKISQIQTDLQSTSKPPFLSNKVDKELNQVFEKVSSEVKESIEKYCEYLKKDPVYDLISELFKDRITSPFTSLELDKIYKEGEERFKNKIPPGFEDEKNKENNNKFGDLVLWKQIIKQAKELKRDVILITDERKKDWWWKIKDGRNMGPRQELVEELKLLADVDFHMYSSERFLSYGQSFLKEKINQKALNEIQAMKKAEIEEIKNLERFRKAKIKQIEALRDEISHSQTQIEELEYILRNMNNELDHFSQKNIENYYSGDVINMEPPEHFKVMLEHKKEFEEELETIKNRVKKLRKVYFEAMNDASS